MCTCTYMHVCKNVYKKCFLYSIITYYSFSVFIYFSISLFNIVCLQNRGIYMFRLDEERVVDATLCGGLARYINHSCNPNCVAEIVEVERDLRIIIFAKRRISRGEEVTIMSFLKLISLNQNLLLLNLFVFISHFKLS